MKKIILSGYMGSGKSTVGALLAKASGIPLYDLDTVIENRTGKSIPELFKDEGEVKFRKTEHTILNEVVAQGGEFIISMGGGTPCYAENHKILQRDDVVSFYLKAGIDTLISRINNQKSSRPLLENLNEDEQRKYIAKHLFDRSYFYMQSKHIVTTDGKTPQEVVNEIMSTF